MSTSPSYGDFDARGRVKVLEENRHAVNRHQLGQYMPKVSFTHLIGWAMQSVLRVPSMAAQFVDQDGKPFRRLGRSPNVGIAVDLPGKDTEEPRRPEHQGCANLDFAGFFRAFNDQIQKSRNGATPDDFADTTCTLTNPGTIGTVGCRA